MAVLINFKICDNSRECSGIKVCPSGALYWNDKKKTLSIDNSKCISCGKCEESCPVGAIRFAKNERGYKKIKKEISKDPRKISDLFIDRYGAESIDPTFLIRKDEFDAQVNGSAKMLAIEVFNSDSIQCLLHSIPVKNLFKGKDIMYSKMEGDESFLIKYKINKLPSLLFFSNGKVFGKIEGYFEIYEEEKLKKEINKIMSKMKKR